MDIKISNCNKMHFSRVPWEKLFNIKGSETLEQGLPKPAVILTSRKFSTAA